MIYFLAGLFFTFALLSAAVALHLIVRNNWAEILLALRGELGLEPRAPAVPHGCRATDLRQAAS